MAEHRRVQDEPTVNHEPDWVDDSADRPEVFDHRQRPADDVTPEEEQHVSGDPSWAMEGVFGRQPVDSPASDADAPAPPG